MKRKLLGMLALFGALGSPGACTTSIDAVGAGGNGDVGAIAVGNGITSTIATTTAGTGVYPDSPCGSFYDWPSCEVLDGDHAEMPIDDATQMLAGTWRRCNDDFAGTFPVGVRFVADGTVYRLFRMPNPGAGSQNIVYCTHDSAHQGTWALEENTGGGSAGMSLDIEWDDGASFSTDLVIYDGVPAFGLLHGAIDDESTERFTFEADAIPGS
jgi:hypothetical protein